MSSVYYLSSGKFQEYIIIYTGGGCDNKCLILNPFFATLK